MDFVKIYKFIGLDVTKVLAIPLSARTSARSHPVAESSYFRIKLAQMSLEKSLQLFSERYPVVHSDVQFDVIGGTANVTRIISPIVPGTENKKYLSRVLVRDQGLSDIIVYRGGPIHIDMGLFSAPGDIWANRFFELAKTVTTATGSVSLSSALALAEPVTRSIQDLTRSEAMTLMIGIKLDLLSPGLVDYEYLAVVGSSNGNIDKKHLRVVEGTLYYEGHPLESADFILLRIDFLPERNDLSKLDISKKGEDLVRKAAELFAENTAKEDYPSIGKKITKLYQYFIAQVFSSEVLTLGDRNRLIQKVREKILDVRNLFQQSDLFPRMRGAELNPSTLIARLEKAKPDLLQLRLDEAESGSTHFSDIIEAMNFQLE
jgi:hypothetical protein